MGCWTSASRKAVLPVFEQYNGMLYYPTFYEGLEQSKNVIYTGQEATQQIIAGLDWVQKTKGAKTFYLLGSDYIWPRTSNKIARKHIEGHLKESKVVGEEYFPLGSTQFNSVINKIKLTKPDVIYAIIVGGSNVAFYKQLKAAGIDLSKQTLLTISVTEDEIDGIGGENIAGAFACMKYFQSLDNAEQQGLRARVQEDVGREDRDRRRDAGRLSRPVAVEVDGGEGGLASTSTRSLPLPRASSSRARRKVMSASTRTITSGRRPASARRRRMVSTNWSTRPPISSSRIRSRRATSKRSTLVARMSASDMRDLSPRRRGLAHPGYDTAHDLRVARSARRACPTENMDHVR